MTPTRKARCGDKPRYDNKARADAVRRWMIANLGSSPSSIGAYHCPWCDGYHVGHRTQNANEHRGWGR